MRAEYRLPKLDDHRIVLVRRCYVALAVFVLFALAGNLISDTLSYFIYEPAAARYGFTINAIKTPAPRIVPLWLAPGPNRPPEESRIVGVDGIALRDDDTYLRAETLIAHAGPVLVLDVRDDDGHVSRHRLPRGPQGGSRLIPGENVSLIADNISTMLGEFLGDLVPLIITLTLFRRRTNDPEAMLFAFAFLMMANTGGNDAWPHAIGLPAPWLIGKSLYVLTFSGWSLMLAGICGFPDGRFTTRWSRIVAVFQIVWGLFFIFGRPYVHWRDHHATDIAIFFASMSVLVLRYRALPPGMKRQQIKWALFGAVIMALTMGLTAIAELPTIADRLGALQLLTDNLVVIREIAFPLGLFVSLLRFRLYDADNVIFRSAGVGGLTVALVGVFAAVEQITQSTSQQFLGDSLGNWSSGVGAAAAALTIGPLNHRIMHTIERRFRSKLALLRDGLPLLLAEKRETATPRELAEATLASIEEGVHARSGAIVQGGVPLALHHVRGEQVATWLAEVPGDGTRRIRETERSDALFPVRIALPGFHGRAAGWLLLGPRPDGSLYPHEERETLSDAADAIARSLAIAEKRRERDDQQDQRIDALHRISLGLQQEVQRLNEVIAGLRRAPGTE